MAAYWTPYRKRGLIQPCPMLLRSSHAGSMHYVGLIQSGLIQSWAMANVGTMNYTGLVRPSPPLVCIPLVCIPVGALAERGSPYRHCPNKKVSAIVYAVSSKKTAEDADMADNDEDELIMDMKMLTGADAAGGRCICRGRGTVEVNVCLLYTSPSPRDGLLSRMPSSA